jgi:hypothetical protein
MTTVTLQLDESLLNETKAEAESRHSSLDEVIADALLRASSQWKSEASSAESVEERRDRLQSAIAKFSRFDTGGPYTREEMNER